MKTYIVFCTLLLLGVLALSTSAQDPCTLADYEAQYTQCRADQTHDLIWYKKRTANCTGGQEAPTPTFDLPCNITCGDGQYLPLGQTACASCNPGFFSKGGSTIVNNWDTWPENLGIISTYCRSSYYPYGLLNCSGWVLSNGILQSGHLVDSQSSFFELQVQLLFAGHIHFTYRVDAEVNYDGLIFIQDGNTTLPKTSLTPGFVEFYSELAAGYHVLQWQYFKDSSVSKGEDAAFVSIIEIFGLTYADSSCTPCAPGSYSPSNGATSCLPCQLNYYSEQNATECVPCPAGQYAYQGTGDCLPKPPCTANDYQYIDGPCTGATLTSTANWLQPFICDDTSLPLPPPTTKSCGGCLPGYAPDGSGNCQVCPAGTYSQSGTSCLQCGTGNYAPRITNLASFDTWPSNTYTYCTGDCGTNGWRLRNDFIDSGAGHGSSAVSVFQLNVTLEQIGHLGVVYSVNCNISCEFSITDYPFNPSVTFKQSSYTPFAITSYNLDLEPGVHSILFSFYGSSSLRTENVRIYALVVDGTTTGGAETCSSCSNGSVSTVPTSVCTNCTVGQGSNDAHSQCIGCFGDTFNNVVGGGCMNCGPQTTANAAHTDCVNSCHFTIGGNTYDLANLTTSNGYFGPIDNNPYKFYISLCKRGNFPAVCKDEDAIALDGYICQVQQQDVYSLDVGWLPGYYPLSDGSLGFVARYTMGTPGCGPVTGGANYPRVTNISFICDPTAGVGQAGPPAPFGIENPPCNYNLVWRSLYACPLCTEAMYSYFYTPCIANTRQKVFYWLDAPLMCHDGATLPQTAITSCSESIVSCGIGLKLSADGQGCVPCGEGEYSVGGGLLGSNWPVAAPSPNLANGFTSVCDSTACTYWTSDDGFSIHSGIGDSSLLVSFTVATTAQVSFDYKVYSVDTGYFQFLMDGQVLLKTSLGANAFEWQTFRSSIPLGSHSFRWSYVDGLRYPPTLLTYQGVTVRNILLTGNTFNTDTCSPCPAGTYSPNDTVTIGCQPCPADTYSLGQNSYCLPCPTGTFSFPGASSCTAKPQCSSFFYEPVFSPCGADNTRTVTYLKLLPDLCSGGYTPPAGTQVVPCAPCPATTTRSGFDCVGCPAGQYFNTATQSCANNVAGYLVQRVAQYFIDNSTSVLPPVFSTHCSGLCGSPGWRFHASLLDAGFHGSNAVDSYITLNTNLTIDGSLRFDYMLSVFSNGTVTTGIIILVDGQTYPIPSSSNGNETTVTIPLAAGPHTIVWNYHQDNVGGIATLRNIYVVGAADGEATLPDLVPCNPGQYSFDPSDTQCSICGPGTYSGNAGAQACALCEENTYNPTAGQGECLPCGDGSFTEGTGAQRCITDCIYDIAGKSYDLTTLGPVTTYDSARQQYHINVCDVVGDQCPNSYVCVITTNGSVIEIGNSFRLVAANASDSEPTIMATSAFSIAFEHGSSAGCPAGTSASTDIQFQCDPSGTAASGPTFIEVDDNCVYRFYWQTITACPVCTDSDYKVTTGVCDGSHRQISKTRINDCNGPATLDVPDESCSSHEFPTGAVVAVVVVFVVVVAVAAFIIWRNRRLAQRYNALMEETRSANTDKF